MQLKLLAGVVLVGSLMLGSVGHAQMGGGMGGGIGGGLGGGMTNIPGTAFGGATDPGAGPLTEGFRLIPSLMVGQRYDSNVLFMANGRSTPGLSKEDWVTTTIPQVRGLYVGSLATVEAMASAVGEYYAKNSGLSYVGTRVGGLLDVSRLANRVWEGTRVRISDTYSYTPQPPAFLTGDLSGEGANPFVRGYQVGRVNTQTNVFNVTLTAPLTAVLNLTGAYTNGFIKFGASDVQQPGQLFNTNYQTYTSGLALDLSRQDTVSLNFVGADYSYDTRGTFSTHGGTVGWSRRFTPNVTLNSAAGALVVEPSLNTGASSAATVAPVGNVALLWNDRTTTLTAAYTIGVTPSYQFQSATLRTQVVSLNLVQQTAIPELLGVVGVNFGHGEQIGAGSTGFTYTAWGGTGGLTYRVTPQTYLGLTYSYANNNQSFGGQGFLIERQVVQVSLAQAF